MRVELLAVLTLACLPCSPVLSQETLPSLNYWDLAGELVRDRSFAERIDLSPDQVEALKDLRSSEEFSRRLSAKVSELEAEFVLSQRAAAVRGSLPNIRQQAFLSLDKDVREMLAEILLPEQLEGLRSEALKLRFPRGYSPYQDLEVARFCDVRVPASELVGMVAEEKKLFSEAIEPLTNEAVVAILDGIGVEQRDRFAQYVGMSYWSDVKVRDSQAKVTVPSPPLCKSPGILQRIARDKSIQGKAELTQAQLKNIRLIDSSFSKALRSYRTDKRAGESFPSYIQRVGDICLKQYELLLSDQQLLAVSRSIAKSELGLKLTEVFQRAELLDYLDLTEEEKLRVRKRVQDQQSVLQTKISEQDRKTFLRISGVLDTESRGKITSLFKDVW